MLSREEMQRRYSLRKNIAYAWKDMKAAGKKYYLLFFLDVFCSVLGPFLLVLLPARVVFLLEQEAALSELCMLAGCMLLALLLINLIKTYCHQEIEIMGKLLRDGLYWKRIHARNLYCPLSEMESKRMRDWRWEAINYMYADDGYGNYAGVIGFYMYLVMLCINAGGFLLYALVAGRLHILLFVLLLLTSLLNCYAKTRAIRYQFSHMGRFWENASRFWYLKNESINVRKAKDIRMYHLYERFQKLLKENTQEACEVYGDIEKHHAYAKGAISVSSLARDSLAYLFLIWQMMQGRLDAAGFVAYIGIIAGFGTWITQIVESYTYLQQIGNSLSVYRCFVEKKTDKKAEGRIAWDTITQVEFRDVSFGYEGAPLLFEHFNCTLHAGEHIALVGVNGAGKTTLMKLLCGLYPLKKGAILVNGEDISKLDEEAYRQYISILFQDVRPLPFTIAENVACSWYELWEEEAERAPLERLLLSMGEEAKRKQGVDEKRVEQALRQAGLWEKVCSLPDGIHTVLTQIMDKKGISLSGGELQRLMLARALYKDASLLILDEPTAALDPLAESALYEEYAHLCEGKISLFISHRLSSTRFCDRILFLKDGSILEEGTHEELMKLQGEYARMFEVQAQYYQKEVRRNEAGI